MNLKAKVFSVCLLLFSAIVVHGDDRFEQGVVGEIVSVETSRSPATVTIQLDGKETKLNLDLARTGRVTVAFEDAALTDLKPGAYAALLLGNDYRTVQAIHASGEVVQVTIRTVDAAKNILTASLDDDDDEGDDDEGDDNEGDDDEGDDNEGDDNEGDDNEGEKKAARPQPREFLISPAARLSIGGLPATLADLQPGMNVPVELGKDGKLVHGINAEAAEGTIVEGRITAINSATKTLRAMIESDDQETEQSFTIATTDNITLDGKKGSLADLKPGSGLKLRLNSSKASVQAIAATSPEADDE